MQNSRYPMVVAITQNLVNIAASLFFVYVLGFGIKGVALGMVTAQYSGLAMCVALWRIKYASGLPRPEWAEVFDARGMSRFFSVNKDIFLRTVCIVFVMSYFTSAGAAMNDTVLAVNALLMQLFIIFSYFMDGFAYAGEALVGRYVGERNRPAFSMVVRQLLYVGAALAVVFTLFYFAGGRRFLSMLTDDNATVSAAMVYLPWAACVPVVSFGAFCARRSVHRRHGFEGNAPVVVPGGGGFLQYVHPAARHGRKQRTLGCIPGLPGRAHACQCGFLRAVGAAYVRFASKKWHLTVYFDNLAT